MYYYIEGGKASHNAESGGLTEKQKFDQIKVMFQVVFDALKKRFPNVPIIPTFGNNDNMRNYMPPTNPGTSEPYD